MARSDFQHRSPYQGLIPFDESDADCFFGRDTETRLVIANLFASPLTLLYGASGVGKTSILRAGVIQQLRQREDKVLVVIFNAWQDDPITSIKAAINRAAKSVSGQLPGLSDSASLSEHLISCAEVLDRRLMIIFDQFQEYFLYHPQDDKFVAEFSKVVMQNDVPINFLLSLREDYLARLDRFEDSLPNLFDNYLRVEHLDRAAAREAIKRPLEQYNRHVRDEERVDIEDSLIDAVLEQLTTGRVVLSREGGEVANAEDQETRIETPFLQLVMLRLWEAEMSAGSRLLRIETLMRLGGAQHIALTHLDATMDDLTSREREIAADIFKYLVTPSGAKIALAIPDLAAYTEIPLAELAPLMERLSAGSNRILHGVTSLADEVTQRYEIFHDVLSPAILDWRRRYIEGRNQQMEEQRWAQKMQEEERRRERELVERTKKMRYRLLSYLAILLVLLTLVMGAMASYAIRQKRLADHLLIETRSTAAEAEGQRNRAESALQEAEQAREQAKQALEQRNIAEAERALERQRRIVEQSRR